MLCASWTTSSCQHQALESTLVLNYYGKFVENLSKLFASTSPTAAGRYKVELVPTMRRSIQDLQTASAKEQVACSLRHRDEAETHEWCISIRSRSSHLTCSTIRWRTPYCICITESVTKWEKLCSNWEGSPEHNIRSEEVSQIPLRKELLTDHKPLLAILGPKSAITTLAELRMQRWALILLAYDYKIEYICRCTIKTTMQ